MAFKALFLAHAPDARPDEHKCVIETDMYELFAVLVRDQKEAVDVSKRLVKEEGIHSIIMCPGCTHTDVAEISEAVGKDISVSVARGDPPGMRAAQVVMEREGWFSGLR